MSYAQGVFSLSKQPAEPGAREVLQH